MSITKPSASVKKFIKTTMFVVLVLITIYLFYRISGYHEHFALEKVAGITTIMGNVSNGSSSPSNSNTNKVKIMTASEDDNRPNEINAPFKSSPSVAKPVKVITQAVSTSPATAPNVPLEPSDLTAKEKQLFDAFFEKRITDDKIHELIESGILTEQLVEKFLSMIDDLPEGPPVSRAPKKLSAMTSSDKKDDNLLEGFTGNNYASANSF